MILGIEASRANRAIKTGIEWYAWHIIEELKKIIPEEIGVILYTDCPLSGDLAKLPKNWQVKVLKWPLKIFWTQARLSLEMFLNPPDVLFVPASPIPLVHPAKTINTIHDVGFRRFPKFYGLFSRFYLNWSTKFALRKAEKIIVPSDFTQKEILDIYQASLKKIAVIPHGINHRLTSESGLQSSARLQTILQQPFILFLGRLIEKKNISRVIEAFRLFKREHPDLRLSLVLAGPFGKYPSFKKLKTIQGWGDDILHLNWLPPEEIALLLKGAEALIFPSLYEGFGLPILEAFAAGAPVLTSRGGALEEVAGGAALFVDPFSARSITDGINKIVFDKNLRGQLRQAGAERASQFSWTEVGRKTWQTIKEMIK